MGKRGPQKTPTVELAKRGSWLAKTTERQNELEIVAPATIPAAPAWLGGPAHDIWEHIAPELHANGLLTNVDVHILGLFCARMGEYLKLADQVEQVQRGELDLDIQMNDLIKARDTASTDALRLGREFGSSPAARAGLVMNNPAKPKGDIVSLFAKG